MRRIALVIAGPYPALRGSQVLVGQLARGLEARGHTVHLVTHGRLLATRPGPSLRRVLLDAVLVARLLRCVRALRIDVLHAHNYEGALAAVLVGRITGRPVVYHGHSAMAEELPTYAGSARMRRALGALGAWLDRTVPRQADFCIAVTEELGGVLRRGGVAAGALACIEPAPLPEDLAGIAPGCPGAFGVPRVCYAGNLDGYQNVELLLASFARVRDAVPDARLVLVTHADAARGAARLRARGPTVGVDVLPVATYADVRAELDRATVAVLPRTERSGFPMKLLNYMAAGKAIVAAAGSAKGLLDGVNARVVADGQVEEFAQAVVDLLRDPVLRARLGGAARATVGSPAAWGTTLDRIEAIYDRVLARADARLLPAACPE